MKRLFISICAIAAIFPASAVYGQENDGDKSTIMLDGSIYDAVFSWAKKDSPEKKDKKWPNAREAHWAGLSFAFSDLDGLPGQIDLRLERSYSICWNVVDWEAPIHSNWLFVSGFGFDWSRFHFGGNDFLKNDNGVTGFFRNEQELKDSKLLVYYGKIPLLLECQARARSGRVFYIQGGVEGLIKLYSKSMIEVRNGRHTDKENFRNLQIYPVNARLFMKFGFGGLGIFGYYQPFSMFKANHGPELHSFGFGISLN